MKTIKSERLFCNRYGVVLAVGSIGLEKIDGYDQAFDVEVVDGEDHIGKPIAVVNAETAEAKRANENEAKEAARENEKAARENEKAARRMHVEQSILAAVKSRHSQPGIAYGAAFDSWHVIVKAPTWTEKVRVDVALDSWKKPCVEVGYREPSRFPLNKKGEFNYDKIAERIVGAAEAAHREAVSKSEKETKLAQSQRIVTALRAEHGIGEYSTAVMVEATAYAADKVMVRIALELTASEADELLTTACRIKAERDARHEVEVELHKHAQWFAAFESEVAMTDQPGN